MSAEKKPAPRRVGRPSIPDNPMERTNIYLDPASKAEAKRLGNGKVSVGVRLALARTLPKA